MEFGKDELGRFRGCSAGVESPVIDDVLLFSTLELLVGTPDGSFSSTEHYNCHGMYCDTQMVL